MGIETMKEYLITQLVEAKGTQQWLISASSKEEALEKLRSGQGEIIFEDFEVTNLIGSPKIELNK